MERSATRRRLLRRARVTGITTLLWSSLVGLSCLQLFEPDGGGGGEEPGGEELARLLVTPSAARLYGVGDSVRLSVEIAGAASGEFGEESLHWASLNEQVATVTSIGTVVAKAVGIAVVTVSCGDCDAQGDSAVVQVFEETDAAFAFPEAEGWGAKALEGCDRRGLQVRHVTNLRESGPGSLRDAIDSSDPERLSVVVFRTGGTLRVSSPIVINRACLYIAGQTAPGDGFQINSKPHGALLVPRDGSGQDVVIRYMRFRSGKGEPGTSDVVDVHGGHRIVFDHVSAQWGNDEVFTIRTIALENNGREASHITVQRSIIAAGLVPHSTGSLVSFGPGVDPPLSHVTLHHNLFAHNAHRNPHVGARAIQIVNNVVYNWKGRVGSVWDAAEADFIRNYWKGGPWRNKPHVLLQGDGELASLYLAGNIMEPLFSDSTQDQTALIRYDRTREYRSLPPESFRSSPLGAAFDGYVDQQTAADAYLSVLEDVGANARLNCRGQWVPAIDRVDQLIIDQVRTGTGPGSDTENDHEDDYGGIPTLAEGTPCADLDMDGMPDAFELRYGLNPNDPSDAARLTAAGYTNLEAYLNGLRPDN